MIRSTLAAWACALGLMAFSAAAQAAPEFPATLTLAGKTLALNGTGMRYKVVFKVYEAGLYASGPVRSVEELVALPGPKAMRLVARRDIPTAELGKMLLKGVADSNPREEVMRQLVGMAQVGGMFGSRNQVSSGESFGFQYLPGSGTRLLVNDKPVGEPVLDPAFFPLLMRIWLGPRPVDERLKAGLLGQPLPDPHSSTTL